MMSDEQKPQIDPSNARKVAAWLNRGRRVFAKNQVAERAAEQAAQRNIQMAQRAQLAEQRRQEQIANIRTGVAGAAAVNVTPGNVAAFLWMPQLRMSFQGFGFAFALLVQTFAQVLMTVGLLPPDHPARSAAGAKGFGIFQLLEEARLNLLPIRAILERNLPEEFAGIRVLATRQYTVFGSIIGIMVTGALAVLFGLARVIFGTAHAYAQSAASGTVTSGTGIGACSLASTAASATSSTSTAVPDLASNCIDGIFGTGANSAGSLVGAGLGQMFSLYSGMMLVFAGIIVLWIIISAVAETARTGVPFGKNFNPVWAPIRLIVALGLLVPLGSGLNSGQYIVLSLAKWGSHQGTAVWSAFANKMIAGTSTNGASPGSGQSQNAAGGMTTVPLDTAPIESMANNLFHVLLCQEVSNQVCGSTSGASCTPASQVRTTPPPPASTIKTVGTAGAVTTSNDALQSKITTVKASDAAQGGVNCGQFATTIPQTYTQAQSNSADSSAASALMNGQSNNFDTLVSSLDAVAVSAAKDSANAVSVGKVDLSQYYTKYQSALQAYYDNQTKTISTTISSYNTALAKGLSSTAQKDGWIDAPIWIAQIAQQNANVLGAVQVMPTVQTPPVENVPGYGTSLITSVESVEGVYKIANDDWTPNVATSSWTPPADIIQTATPKNHAADSIISDLQELTSQASTNPLATAGTYGRQMLLNGFVFIQPNGVKCMQDPSLANCNNSSATENVVNQAEGQGHTHTILPSQGSLTNSTFIAAAGDPNVGGILYPLGMIMISMGFLLVMLTFIPLMRFLLGILNWILLLFEAVLAVPLVSLSLLKTDGDGFATQQFQSNLTMLLGVILRPVLMTIGLVLGLIAFNTIMSITNTLFAPAAAAMTPASDNSLLTLGIYVMVYGSLAYTLANSAFKAIDMLPNYVMAWIGQRMESRVDDASAIQQQTSGYMQTLAYSSRGGGSTSAIDQLAKDSQTQANLKNVGISDPNINAAVDRDRAALAQQGQMATGGTGTSQAAQSPHVVPKSTPGGV